MGDKFSCAASASLQVLTLSISLAGTAHLTLVFPCRPAPLSPSRCLSRAVPTLTGLVGGLVQDQSSPKAATALSHPAGGLGQNQHMLGGSCLHPPAPHMAGSPVTDWCSSKHLLYQWVRKAPIYHCARNNYSGAFPQACLQQSWPIHNRRAQAAHTGNITGVPGSGDQRNCTSGPQRGFWT